MGLSRRKKSGKKIGGSSLIVVGQPIYSTKTFQTVKVCSKIINNSNEGF